MRGLILSIRLSITLVGVLILRIRTLISGSKISVKILYGVFITSTKTSTISVRDSTPPTRISTISARNSKPPIRMSITSAYVSKILFRMSTILISISGLKPPTRISIGVSVASLTGSIIYNPAVLFCEVTILSAAI